MLSDEKFATLAGEEIYLFLIAQGELIWFTEWLESTTEESFNAAIAQCPAFSAALDRSMRFLDEKLQSFL